MYADTNHNAIPPLRGEAAQGWGTRPVVPRLRVGHPPCCVVPEARPGPILRLRNQTTLDWVAMDIADHFGAGLLSVDIAVVIAGLPELFARSSQLARSHLLDAFQKLRQYNLRRFIDKKMDMFGHQDVGVNSRMMLCASLFQHRLERLPGSRRFKKR